MNATKTVLSITLPALLALAACGSSETEQPAVAASPPAASAAPAAPTAPAAASAPIAIAGPGFTFQPVSGAAGGPVDGAQMGEGCIGNFPSAPQHTLHVGAAIPRLRVLVNAGVSADTTLAVRTPGGQTVCNDDSGDPANSLNPVVEIENAAPGAYQVFVGGYSTGDSWASYRLGVNETAGQYPSQAVPNP